MKVLILSCSTGEGHNSAAQAIYKEFKAEHDEVIKKDFLSLYKKRKKQDFFSGAHDDCTSKQFANDDRVAHIPTPCRGGS